jgi:L-iditol 2-dehydrogenase
MMQPTHTRAAVLVEYGKPLEIRDIEIPEPEPNGLVVKILAATVCGTDYHICDGAIQGASQLPLILGHEMIGEIVGGQRSAGDALGRPLNIGDRIAWAYAWCGQCYACTISGEPTLCERPRRYGWGPVTEFPHLTGGFAEHAYVMPECGVVKVPDGLDSALAASATCALRTAVHAYERVGGVSPGAKVVVQGSGPVGLYATAYAALSGAAQVICIGAPQDRLDLAERLGATMTLNIENTDVAQRREAIMSATDGRGVDVMVECSGAASAMPEGIELGRDGASYAVIGQTSDQPVPIRANAFTGGQLTITGVKSGDITHYYRGLELLAQHAATMPFHELLGNRYDLDHINDAIDAIRSMKEIKPVIIPASG